MEETNDLLSFSWDEIDNETPQPEQEEKQKEQEGVKKEEQEDFSFEEKEEQEEILSKEEKEDSPKQEGGGYWKDVYEDFKASGLLRHVELEEGEELNSEKLFELQQEDYEKEIAQRLSTWAEKDLDEDAKAFIKFKVEGGNTEDFFKAYKESEGVPEGDIDEEEYQDKVIRWQLNQEGWDKEEIEDRLAYLTESGKKKSTALRYDKKVKDFSKTRKEAVLEKQIKNKQVEKVQKKEYKQQIFSTLKEANEINGFKITDKDKRELANFLTKETHKIGENRYVTGFQKKMQEIFKDTEKVVLLAKLISNDFNVDDLKKKVETKKIKEVKSKLEQRRNLRPLNSGSSLEGSSLADLFN